MNSVQQQHDQHQEKVLIESSHLRGPNSGQYVQVLEVFLVETNLPLAMKGVKRQYTRNGDYTKQSNFTGQARWPKTTKNSHMVNNSKAWDATISKGMPASMLHGSELPKLQQRNSITQNIPVLKCNKDSMVHLVHQFVTKTQVTLLDKTKESY